MQDSTRSAPDVTQKFSLRPATDDDLPAILGIEHDSYPSPWTEQHFRAERVKPYARFLVLTDDETDTEVAGYIVYWMLFDEAQILNVAVGLNHRGQGFGKQLVSQAVREALKGGLKRVTLEVRKSNAAAIRLYSSLGFRVGSERKRFYSDGEDALQMEVDLTGEPLEFL